MSEPRQFLSRYLQSTGLARPADAAQQFQVTLLQQCVDHLDQVLADNGIPATIRMTVIREFIYGTVPVRAEAELRTAMTADMTAHRAQHARPESRHQCGTS